MQPTKTRNVTLSARWLCLVALVALAFGGVAQDWRGFHGLERQGIGENGTAPVNWAAGISTNWKASIPGFGFSSPVISRDKVYLTTAYHTNKGSGLKTAATYCSLVLAWGLLAITAIIAICASAGEEWVGRRMFFGSGRVLLLMSVVLVVVGACSFASGLFSLESLILRSWKVGTVVSFASLFIAFLLTARQKFAFWTFALAATLLSVAACIFMPRRSDFIFDFQTAQGIFNAAIALGPAIVAWALCVGLLLVRRATRPPANRAKPISSRARYMRVVLCCAVPVALTAGVFWLLIQRLLKNHATAPYQAPDEPGILISLDPVFGWSLLAFAAMFSVVAIPVGSLLLSRRPSLRRSLIYCGGFVALLLAVTCFLRFGCLPSQRQLAYAVACFDKKTGSLHWLHELDYSATVRDFKGANSHANPTVAVGSDHLCAYFGSAGLFGMGMGGNISWKIQDAEFDSPFGVGHSPVMADNFVILANDNERFPNAPAANSHIIAYSVADGRVQWRQKRQRSAPGSAGFSTPIVRTIQGRKTVLMRGWEDLTAYDLQTGKVLWTYALKHRGNFLVAGLVTDDKRVYVLDATRVLALDLAALAEGRDATVWIAQVPGEKVASPLLVDNLLFVANETGTAFCLDVESGTVAWREKLGKRFFSSIVAQGPNVVFTDESGQVSVVGCARSFALVAQAKLPDQTYATPVPMDDGLLVRAGANLYYLGAKKTSSTDVTVAETPTPSR